jgi:hypothetical protein
MDFPKTHHPWCNFDPTSPVENCIFCKKAYKNFPLEGRTEEEMMKAFFPDAILRTGK